MKTKLRKGLALVLAAVLVTGSFTYFGNNLLKANTTGEPESEEIATTQLDGSSEYAVTKNLMDLITGMKVDGNAVTPGTPYEVKADTPYELEFSFQENTKKDDKGLDIEFDMTDYIEYQLPKGVAADGETGVVEINVTAGQTFRIEHDYEVKDNKLVIHWNKADAHFADLASAHSVTFNFKMNATFDGSEKQIAFDGDGELVVDVDKSKLILTKTVNIMNSGGKVVSNEIPADQLENLKFDIKDGNGKVVATKTLKDFTYSGGRYTLEITSLPYGTYTVEETDNVTGLNWKSACVGAKTITDKDEKVETKPFDIVRDAEVSAPAFINNYEQQVGNLEITKATSGATTPDEAVFEVYGPGVTHSTQGATPYATFKYKDMKNGKYTLSDLPLGEYEVIEKDADVSGYILKVTGSGGTATVTDGNTATLDIKNDYKKLGKIKITKAVTGDLPKSVLDDEAFQKAIVFTIYDCASPLRPIQRDGKDYTLTYYDVLNGNDTFVDLPEGEYCIKETVGSAAKFADYKLTQSPMTDKGGKTAYECKSYEVITPDYTDKDMPVVNFKNDYKKVDWVLNVDKIFAEDSVWDETNLPERVKSATKFSIQKKNEAGTFVTYVRDGVNQVFTYNDLKNGALTNYKITEPGFYRIVETNYTETGLTTTVWYKMDTGNFSETGWGGTNQVEYKEGTSATHSFTFKNKYEVPGYIDGDKTIVGLDAASEASVRAKLLYTVYKYDDKSKNFIPFKSNLTLAELEAGFTAEEGKYYVQEEGGAGAKGYDGPEVSTQVGDDASTKNEESCTNIFELKQGKTVTVHFTNKYTSGTGPGGTLSGEKYVRGLEELKTDQRVLLPKDLEVKQSGNTKKLYDVIRVTLQKWDDAKGNYVTVKDFTLDDLSKGAIVIQDAGKYLIRERGCEVDGYSWKANYLIKGPTVGTPVKDGNVIKFEVDAGQNLEVEITNVYTRLGELELSKTVTGVIDIDTLKAAKTTTFVVTNPLGVKTTYYLHNYSQFTPFIVIKNLPVGEYKITENNGAVNGTSMTTTVKVGTGQAVSGKTTTVEVTSKERVSVTFNNDYQWEKGELVIKKVLNGVTDSDLTADQKKAMSFQLYYSADKGTTWTDQITIDKDGNNNWETKAVIVTYDKFTNGEYKIENLKTGMYKVVETVGTDITAEYVVTTSYSYRAQQANGTYKAGSQELVSGKSMEATVTNKFEQGGKLKLEKSFEGDDLTDAEKATIKFTVTGPNGFKKEILYSEFDMSLVQAIKGALGGSGVATYTIYGVPLGEYTIVETGGPGADQGYTKTTKIKVNGGNETEASEITSKLEVQGEEDTISFINKYTKYGSLIFEKIFAGTGISASDLTKDQKDAIKFSVKKVKSDGSYVDAVRIDGSKVDDFSYSDIEKDNGKVTIEGLPEGEYVVIETITDADLKAKFGEYTWKAEVSSDNNTWTLGTEIKGKVEQNKDTNVYIRNTLNKVVEKGLLNYDEDTGYLWQDDGKGGKVYVNTAQYKIALNKSGVKIGDADVLTAEDVFSANMSIIESSIKFTDLDGKEIQNAKYSLDKDNHKLTFTIPNGQAVVIQYSAVINAKGKVKIENEVTLEGHSSKVEKEVLIKAGGGGGGDLAVLNLFKKDADTGKGLSGAEFDLYEVVPGGSEAKQTSFTIDKDDNGVIGKIAFYKWTSGTSGQLNSFKENEVYHLVETKAPSSDYDMNKKVDFYFTFDKDAAVVSTDPDTGLVTFPWYGTYEYTVENTVKKGGFDVTKVVGSKVDTDLTTREFEFKVELDDTTISGTTYGWISDADGTKTDVITFKSGVAEFKLKNGQKASFALPVGIKYTVTEKNYEDMETTWVDNVKDGEIVQDDYSNHIVCINMALGDLVIKKNLDNFYLGDNEDIKPVVFAFKVEGFKDKNGNGVIDDGTDEKLFETMVGITFCDSGTNTETLKNLPGGALIRVTEVYSGTAYSTEVDPQKTTVIEAGKEVTVEFSNKYSKNNEQSGVVNRFDTKDGKPSYRTPGGGSGGWGSGY